jgi:hypothetical protein
LEPFDLCATAVAAGDKTRWRKTEPTGFRERHYGNPTNANISCDRIDLIREGIRVLSAWKWKKANHALSSRWKFQADKPIRTGSVDEIVFFSSSLKFSASVFSF